LIFKLMGEGAEKSPTLSFKSAGSRSRGIALLFGFFDVLSDRDSRAKVQQIKDGPAPVDGDPVGLSLLKILSEPNLLNIYNLGFTILTKTHDVISTSKSRV
jgi:hypothetical protein